jgi:hypothetical protein
MKIRQGWKYVATTVGFTSFAWFAGALDQHRVENETKPVTLVSVSSQVKAPGIARLVRVAEEDDCPANDAVFVLVSYEHGVCAYKEA